MSKLTLTMLARETLMLLHQDRMSVDQLLNKWDARVWFMIPESKFNNTIEDVGSEYLLPAVQIALLQTSPFDSIFPSTTDNKVYWAKEQYRNCRVLLEYDMMTERLIINMQKFGSYPLLAEHLYHWLGELAEAA